MLARIKQWMEQKKFYSSFPALKIFMASFDSRFGKQNAPEALELLESIETCLSKLPQLKEDEKLQRLLGKVRKKLLK